MSSHSQPTAPTITTRDIRLAKGVRKLAMLTAYDYPTARIVDQNGVDMVLVGDSLGMVMLGRKDTLSVTLDEMIHHCRAVTHGVEHALVVADMPFMTYETGVEDALRNSARLFREAGVRAVKVEGAGPVLPQVRAMVQAGIPVMGHIGLTPQRVAELGGFRVQGRTAQAAQALLEQAQLLEDAGCFSIVLECVPAPLAQRITATLSIPTIGIGAGAHCDGQVLVLHDMLGLYHGTSPRFVKRYADLATQAQQAIASYVDEVRTGTFPAQEHAFTMPDDALAQFIKDGER